MAEKVSVILSSFNGAQYLPQQLDSLVGQSYPDMTIQVRDDGSTDGTIGILKRYAENHGNIHLISGTRLGITGSFFYLLRHCGEESEYIAFCDQDDVWYQDKIERAVARLSALTSDLPALYCSRQEYVDHDLTHLRFSRVLRRPLSFRNALVENCATGCTVVLNRAAKDMITDCLPGGFVWHDWWCYLVVSAFGVVIHDQQPGLKYRLHSANDTGSAVSFAGELWRRMRRLCFNGRGFLKLYAQASEFHRLYGDRLGDVEGKLLEQFLASKTSTLARIRFALHPVVYRQKWLDNLLLRALIVLGWY